MAHKNLVGGTAYDTKGGRCRVSGTNYSIKKGRTLVGGTGYDVAFGTPISSLSVGSPLWIDVNGVSTEFIIVHQGNPNTSIYDASCNGTWVLMKDIYVKKATYERNDRDNSVTSYLKGEFYDLLDSKTKAVIKTVKVPYWYYDRIANSSGGYDYTNYAFKSGSSGYSANVFYLSADEVWDANLTNVGVNLNDVTLDYFKGVTTDSEKLCAFYAGTKTSWVVRRAFGSTSVSIVSNRYAGQNTMRVGSQNNSSLVPYGVRPCMILDPSAAVDPTTMELLA